MNTTISNICAGTIRWGSWGSKLSISKMADIISSCYDSGITTFDISDVYGNYTTEKEFGQALSISNIPRQKVQIITKCGIIKPCSEKPGFIISHYNTSKKHILHSFEKSLENLQTEYIDVFMINRPSPLLDYKEIADSFIVLNTGKHVLDFGVVNFSPTQINNIVKYFPIKYHQSEVSFTHLDPLFDGTIDTCIYHDIRPMSWSPIGGGSIFTHTKTGKKLEERLIKVAEKYNWTLSEMAILFLMHHPAKICPVINQSKAEKYLEVKQLSQESISNEQWFEILTASTGNDLG